MLSIPNHHVVQDLFSRVSGKILLQTISENRDEHCWKCRILWGAPSFEFLDGIEIAIEKGFDCSTLPKC